jgi:hypothetical protein
MNKMIKPFSVIVAHSRNGGIGLKGELPWPHLKKDFAHFKRVTTCESLSLTALELAKKQTMF